MTLRSGRALSKSRAGIALSTAAVLLLFGAGGLIAGAKGEDAALLETRGDQPVKSGGTALSAASGAVVSGVDEGEELRKLEEQPRPSSRLLLPRRSSSAGRERGSDAWYVGLASVAVLLGAVGGLALAARRFNLRPGSGMLQVVSRVSLSPKHAVYLVRAGGRVLLVGTGPQGAPNLISELDDIAVSPIEAARGQGEVS